MDRNPQAETFIKALQVTLNDERECERLRRSLRHRDRAERFVQAFWTRVDARRSASEPPLRKRPEPEAARTARND